MFLNPPLLVYYIISKEVETGKGGNSVVLLKAVSAEEKTVSEMF